MNIEDKAYFDKRIEVETWKSPKGTTYIAGLDQGSSGLFQPFITATYSDGGQQLMTGNPPKFKTEGGARKWLSAEITRRKTPNARQGSKVKFAATRIWPNDYGEINNANAKYARLIFDRQKIIRANAGRRIKGEQPLEVPAPPTAPEFPFAFADGDYVGLILGGQTNVPKGATVKWAHNANSIKMSRQGTNSSKAKFANRGAFAEASSSPVLGSLLEKKVMPEGGWRAVETDGAALVIAFEDNDIAGNFARRAAENGYSATAPMAMAGRYWNVKVQNENKQ